MNLEQRTYPIEHIQVTKRQNVNFIDLETTGFKPWAGARIIEFCAIKVGPSEITYFHELAKPYLYSDKSLIQITPMIQNLTGITNEMVANARDSFEVFRDFIEFIGKDKCIAHNALFEKTFLDYYQRAIGDDREIIYMDTLPMFKKVFGQGKLSLLTESSLAHSAFDDTYQMLKVFKKAQMKDPNSIKLCKRVALTEYANNSISSDIVKISKTLLKG